MAGSDDEGAPGAGAGRSGGRLLTALGVIASIVALLLLCVGLGLILIDASEPDEDGFFTSGDAAVATPGYAVTTDEVDLGDADWVPEEVLGDLRLRATAQGDDAVFLGIGPSREVEDYLGGVARSEVTDVDGDGDPVLAERAGERPSRPPASAAIWTAQAEGSGTQEVMWDPEPGSWTAVLMNADGSRAVAAEVSAGMKLGWILWVGIALGTAGLLAGGLGALAIVRGSRRRAEARRAG